MMNLQMSNFLANFYLLVAEDTVCSIELVIL